MLASGVQVGQLMTIGIMAIALGLDAFSLGIGIGMKGIRLMDILKISIVIGLFHVSHATDGDVYGAICLALCWAMWQRPQGDVYLFCSERIWCIARYAGEEATTFDHRTLWGLIIFALSVSIDSFSVGVSLGMFATDIVLDSAYLWSVWRVAFDCGVTARQAS